MTADELLASFGERPFPGFRVFVSDGTTHDVPHPDLLMVGTNATVIGVPSDNRPRLPAYTVKVANDHITKVLPLAAVERTR